MKTLVICTAMSAMILCACGGKNTQSTEETSEEDKHGWTTVVIE